MSGGADRVTSTIPKELQQTVLVRSELMPADSVEVKGHDFSEASTEKPIATTAHVNNPQARKVAWLWLQVEVGRVWAGASWL